MNTFPMRSVARQCCLFLPSIQHNVKILANAKGKNKKLKVSRLKEGYQTIFYLQMP